MPDASAPPAVSMTPSGEKAEAPNAKLSCVTVRVQSWRSGERWRQRLQVLLHQLETHHRVRRVAECHRVRRHAAHLDVQGAQPGRVRIGSAVVEFGDHLENGRLLPQRRLKRRAKRVEAAREAVDGERVLAEPAGAIEDSRDGCIGSGQRERGSRCLSLPAIADRVRSAERSRGQPQRRSIVLDLAIQTTGPSEHKSVAAQVEHGTVVSLGVTTSGH